MRFKAGGVQPAWPAGTSATASCGLVSHSSLQSPQAAPPHQNLEGTHPVCIGDQHSLLLSMAQPRCSLAQMDPGQWKGFQHCRCSGRIHNYQAVLGQHHQEA